MGEASCETNCHQIVNPLESRDGIIDKSIDYMAGYGYPLTTLAMLLLLLFTMSLLISLLLLLLLSLSLLLLLLSFFLISRINCCFFYSHYDT